MAERLPSSGEVNLKLSQLPTRRGRYPSLVPKDVVFTPEEAQVEEQAEQEAKDQQRVHDIEDMFLAMGMSAVVFALHPVGAPAAFKLIQGLLKEPMSEALSDPSAENFDPAGMLIKGAAGFVADGTQGTMG